MLDRGQGADTPGEPDGQPAEHVHSAREDLRGRLDRLPDGHPSATDHRSRSGWDFPDHRDHPDRPVVSEIHITADRARHILDGDAPGSQDEGDSDSNGGSGSDRPGGGHRHGTGLPDKTEFPKSWSDEVVLSTIEHIARHPDAVERQSNARWRVTGEHDSVRVTAVVDTDGSIRTAWPEPGGPGVRHNPKDGGA